MVVANVYVRFWGVRGSVPTPGPATRRYGGNTSCVEMRLGPRRLVFDAGTGIRPMGHEWARSGLPLEGHIFLSHLHLDHVCGLPFFAPAHDPANRFDLWCGHLLGRRLRLRPLLAELLREPFFPIPLEVLARGLRFRDFRAGEVLEPEPGVVVRTAPLCHPGGATGYRVEYEGRILCYVTDVEHGEDGHDPRLVELVRDADLVIYDATFTDEEYPHFRGWGHSTWQAGVRLVEAAGAGRLVVFHHHPDRDDEALDAIAAELERVRPGSLVAREGLVLSF